MQEQPILPLLGAGEPGAAEACLDRFGPLVWSLARRHTHNPAEAEDAVQEIFLSLWKDAGRFDPEKASEATFVAMIARRRLIDLHRRKGARPESSTVEAELDLVPDVAAAQIEERTDVALAARAILELSPRERQTVMLSIYQGMTHSEISSHLELPLGSVKTYIRRGLTQVRKTLEQGRDPLKRLTVAT